LESYHLGDITTMNDPITDYVAHLMAESDHVLVPLEELYDRLISEGMIAWINPLLFEQLIYEDNRFELYDGFGDSEFFNPMVQAELEARGLLGGPLVLLRARHVTDEELMLDMLLHLQEMNKALETAWQLRPSDNPEVEAELLNLLLMGDMLERQIKQALESGINVIELTDFEG
jgi:hypothetical protein